MEVEKTLRPEAPGARKYVERFGERLVCVRHRRDDTRGRRVTTVELVLDERPFPPTSLHWAPKASPTLLLRIAYGESARRRAVKEAGGRWVPELKLWEVPRQQVAQLGLEDRVVKEQSPRSGHTTDEAPRNRHFCPDVGKTQI